MPVKSNKILIIAPDSNTQSLYEQALAHHQLSYQNQLDSTELSPSTFDLIILHHQEDQDSLTLIQNINDQTNSSTAILMIVDDGDEQLVTRALQVGVSSTLHQKELVPAIIAMMVHRTIENKKWEHISKRHTAQANRLMDEKTGLYQLSYFETRLKEEINRSQRYGFGLNLVMFKIESYQHILQKHGKEKSAQLIQSLSHLLRHNTRPSDLIAQIADDQLAILLPHTTSDQACQAWKRIYQQIQEHPFTLDSENHYLTCRAMVTPLTSETQDLKPLFTTFTQALTTPKESKNQIILL